MVGVTGRDGVFRTEFPFGRVYVAVSTEVYDDDWIALERESEVFLRCTAEDALV